MYLFQRNNVIVIVIFDNYKSAEYYFNNYASIISKVAKALMISDKILCNMRMDTDILEVPVRYGWVSSDEFVKHVVTEVTSLREKKP